MAGHRSLCCVFFLSLLCSLVTLDAKAITPLSERLEVETILPVFLNDDTATFVFNNLESANIRVQLAFKDQHSNFSPAASVEFLIGSRTEPQNRDIDISSWPDGDYEVLITEVGTGGSTGTLVRAIRKQSISLPNVPSEPVNVAGVKMLFVDDWYIEQKSGVERVAHQAEQIPIEPWKTNPDYFRFNTWVKTFWFDKRGDLYISLGGKDGLDQNPMDIWVRSSDFQNWEIVPEPIAVEKASEFTRLVKNKVSNRFSGQPTYRYYDPALDGEINLEQVEIIYSGFEDGYMLGDISVPARSRIAVWEKPTGEYLVLSHEPLMTDKGHFPDGDLGEWTDTNDNFGLKTMSMDGSTLRFYQTRAVPRNDPYRVYYDNVFFNRTLAAWSTTDGLNWTPTYFESAIREDPACLQNYGVHVFAEESNNLELAFMRMFDQVTQLTYTDLAYSRDGVQWNRFRNCDHFLANGELGSWNFGFSYATNNRIRVEHRGKYYEPMQGRNVPHFMFLHAYPHADRSFMTADFFMDLYGGRMSGENGLQYSDIWDWYGSWEEVADVAKTDTATAALMCYRKDGWVSLSAGQTEGEILTKVLSAGNKLSINAKTKLHGYVQIEVLDSNEAELPAYCGQNAARFAGDSVEAQLNWSNGNVNELPDVPFKLRIKMQDAEIYALNWEAVQRIVYVKHGAAGSNDGSSWNNAYTDLQHALKNSRLGDQIWVARGTYKPTQETLDISKFVSFELKQGVSLFGGFCGNETSLQQRDSVSNVTILSGDLNGDDGSGFTNYSDNSRHIVVGDYVDQTAIIDGFTITGGCANLDFPHNAGGGLIVSDYGSPTVLNCTFVANYAVGGAAVWARNCDSVFTNCLFSGNESTYYAGAFYGYDNFNGKLAGCSFVDNVAANSGGAVRIRRSNPLIENCSFVNNTSGNSGGGIIITDNGRTTLTNCTFENNSAVGRAGGLYVGESASAKIEGSTFTQNSGPYGGAIRLSLAADVEVVDCIFNFNTASSGGGVYNYGSDQLDVTNCYFRENQTSDYGGALLSTQPGRTDVVNCLFVGNTSNYGGAIRFDGSHPASVINCTFAYNSAATASNAISVLSNSLLRNITNCILRDGGDEIADGCGALFVSYCNIQGGYSGNGNNNIDVNPLFLGAANSNFRLTSKSPCVNTGDNGAIAEIIGWDLDHSYRIADTTVDMGAYEFGATIYKGVCGDSDHPILPGDFNRDCIIDLADLVVITSNWLSCTSPDCQ